MTVLIKLTYAAAVAAMVVLLVAFGVRAFYGPPKAPEYPQPPVVRSVAPVPSTPGPGVATPTVVTPSAEEIARFDEEQRLYQASYEKYEDERQVYRRNVFLISAAIAVMAIGGGASLWSRVDAMSLGFVAGGFATLLYGVIQAGGDLDQVSPAVIFVVVLIGLGAVLAAGYRWLSPRAG